MPLASVRSLLRLAWPMQSRTVDFNPPSKAWKLYTHAALSCSFWPLYKITIIRCQIRVSITEEKTRCSPDMELDFSIHPASLNFSFPLFFRTYGNLPESDKHAMPILHPSARAHRSLVLVSVFNLRPFNHSNVRVAPFTLCSRMINDVVLYIIFKFLWWLCTMTSFRFRFQGTCAFGYTFCHFILFAKTKMKENYFWVDSQFLYQKPFEISAHFHFTK